MARASASKGKARDDHPRQRRRVRGLGFPDAEERQTKLRLAYALNAIMDAQRLTQAAAAARLGLNQPKVSALRNYKLEGFSVERLMTLLNALDQDVRSLFDQIDWLAAFQRGKDWDGVELRPQTLCGLRPGTPMSLAPAIAVYAAFNTELGRPTAFPVQATALLPRSIRSPRRSTSPGPRCRASARCRAASRRGRRHDQRATIRRWQNLWPKLAVAVDLARRRGRSSRSNRR